MKKLFLTLFFGILLFADVWAQNGTIRGTITDAGNGEALIGVTVVIDGTTTGSATDLDGKYSISVAPGIYNLKISYVSYETKTINNVEVKAGQVTVMDATLSEASETLKEIVVEAKVERNTEASILTLQRKSSIVLDGVSSQIFSKTGDNDAASAMRRITGVTVEGGKYVYVRGLGDRYSKTTLNNAEIPSLDPERNAVQLDIFPSNLIDNIVVYKTFSAELPGDFTGGFANIITKDFPDRFTFQWSSSFNYNTNATFNNEFLLYPRGNTDWLGFDNGYRDIPLAAQNPIPLEGEASQNFLLADQLDKATKSFNRILAPSTVNPFLNQRHSLSFGNQYQLFGKPLGIVIGLSYQNDNSFYQDGDLGLFAFSGVGSSDLRILLKTKDTKGTESVLIGGLVNVSYKLDDKNKIGLNIFRNQSGTSSGRYQIGINPQNLDEVTQFETRTIQYLERTLNSFQLKGEHFFPNLANLKLEWHSAYTNSKQDEPDLRFFANNFDVIGEDTLYIINAASYPVPTRYFRTLQDQNFDNKINFTLGYKLNGLDSKLKFGLSYLIKDREFRERIYAYQNPSDVNRRYAGDIDAYLSDSNIGLIGQSNNLFNFGVVINDKQTAPRNSYDGRQTVLGVYLGTDMQISKAIKLNFGARLETTDIETASLDPTAAVGVLDNTDILPAFNMTWELKKDMNLRLGYSRTIARPTFREIAPFADFLFVGGVIRVGNQFLKRSLIDNFDLRWEWYTRPGELLSFSAFYKNFNDPIELFFNPIAQNSEITWRNVEKGSVYGIELELRKRLDFISLNNFQVGINASFIQSEVDIAPEELERIRQGDPNAPATRRLFAQSPYIVNALLEYNNEDSGLEIALSYNVFGERLSVVGAGGTPNVFEQPRNTLNFNISQKFGKERRWKGTFRASNILNPYYSFDHDFAGKKFFYQRYRVGADFSLGINYTIN